MKRLLMLLILSVVLVACGGTKEPDYATAEELESALNAGENPEGKIASIEVVELVPDSAMGYNIQTGEHLNFVSTGNPNVKAGDVVVVKIEKVESMLGSYIITYKKQ